MSRISRRLVVQPEPPSESFGPGVLSDFTQIGDATMAIANGLLTTSDPAQVDAVIETDPAVGAPHGVERLMLSYNASDGGNGGVPTYRTVQGWPIAGPSTHYPAVYTVNNTSDVAGHVGSGGHDTQRHSGVAGNYPGDLLLVLNSGPFISDGTPPGYKLGPTTLIDPDFGLVPFGGLNPYLQDTYVWDGSQWNLLWHWTGPGSVTAAYYDSNKGLADNWEAIIPVRPTPAHPKIYACNWTVPGAFGEDRIFRCQFSLDAALGGTPPISDLTTVGLTIGMSDIDHGLTWFPWGGDGGKAGLKIGGSGWTLKPRDLKRYGSLYPPERVQSGGAYSQAGVHPLTGTFYADLLYAGGYTPYYANIHGGGAYKSGWRYGAAGMFWVDLWRRGNRAYASLYDANPEVVSPVLTSTFPEDLSGGPYDGANDLYFGLVFPYLNQHAGLVNCQIVRIT